MGHHLRHRRRRRVTALASAAALCVLGLTGAPRAAAAASTPCLAGPDANGVVDGDLNGDGAADITVGVPNLFLAGHLDDGGVDVQLSDGGRQQITLDTILGSGGEQGGARFGAAVSADDVDGDGCDDLAVGAPGLDDRGAVLLLRGSLLGIASAGAVRVTAPDGAAGDAFGSSVAVSSRQDGSTDLWVGAPGRTVAGLAQAGAVYHFVVSGSMTVTPAGVLTYATPGVAGDPAAGDRFGSVLAPVFGHVMVGVPRRRVQGHPGAGEVVFGTASGSSLTGQVVNQGTAGVPGSPEDGDHFGAALADRVVGVPGEDVGTVADAGAVQVFDLSNGELVAGSSYTQDSPGVPGTAEKGDQFGASLAVGVWYLCQEETDLAVGAPGEAVGRVRGAGSVSVLGIRAEGKPCAARSYRQGTTLAGALAAGNHVGATLATLSGNDDDAEDERSGLVIGVPGRDGSSRNTGAVLTGLRRTDPVLTAVGGQEKDQSFGRVLATLPG